jgi:biopolymer transport protein ExbD
VTSLAHRARQRRLERATLAAPGNLNLVPLVDILTSIVFFSLLTYRGEVLAQLTAYDLTLPPVVVRAPATPAPPSLTPRLTVQLAPAGATVAAAGWRSAAAPGAAGGTALAPLLAEFRGRYPAAREAEVAPSGAVAYDDVVRVLERLRIAGFTAIALGDGPAAAAAP